MPGYWVREQLHVGVEEHESVNRFIAESGILFEFYFDGIKEVSAALIYSPFPLA